jgi:DNA-binding NtrC family response regulator
LRIPPLRDRRDDIIPLAYYFISHYAPQFHVEPKTLTEDAKQYLLHHRWEGNIRELENAIQRALILSPDTTITAELLANTPGHYRAEHALPPPIHSLAQIEKSAIQAALARNNGNIQKTAKELQISRATLYAKIKPVTRDED